MLGHHPKLRHDLHKHGRRAFAKVREAKRTKWAETTGSSPAGEVENQKVLWKLVLQVEPEGGEPFEAKVEEMLGWRETVEPSERHYRFVVLYDPSDHAKVLIDDTDEGARMLAVHDLKERTDAQVSRMRERGQGDWADRYQAAQDSMAEYIGADHSTLSADEREDAVRAQRQKIRDIMAGDSAQRAEQIRAIQLDPGIPPEEKGARIKELMAGMGMGVPAANVRVGGQPVAGAGSTDPAAIADALTKLADLRDRGALTDAEFQAQKAKLLGT
jgi:hypothetical protein